MHASSLHARRVAETRLHAGRVSATHLDYAVQSRSRVGQFWDEYISVASKDHSGRSTVYGVSGACIHTSVGQYNLDAIAN